MDYRDLFKTHGLRYTRQRALVYGALATTSAHPTAEELYETVRADGDLSLATVYNTIEALLSVGLCRCVHSAGSGAARFDACVGDHVHLVTKDGRVMDVPDDLGQRMLQGIAPDLLEEIESRMGIRIDRVDFHVHEA